jgi:purine-binding chemotaxis protein CheW
MDEALTALLTRLRDDFDSSFARRPVDGAAAHVDVLCVRIGERPFALRVDEIAGVVTGRRIVGLPGSSPALLGLVGLRGALLPVFGLASLLGLPQPREPRWLATCGRDRPIGFAFGGVDAYDRLLPGDVVPGDGGHPAVRAFAQTSRGPRPLVHLPTLTRGALDATAKEL